MALESSLSQDSISRYIKDSEPKKKLKKTRSIKLSKVPSLKPSSRRSKSRFNWLSIDLNDPSNILDFSEAGPHHIEATNSSDARKDSSLGGSEIDEATSVESSSNGSSNLRNSNQTARIQKMFKTYGASRSSRRRTKSRTIQRPIAASKGTATPQNLLSVEDRDGSPHYLKATSSSEGRKADSQASNPSFLSLYDSNDQRSSHVSTPKSVSQKSSLASTPTMRSVRIQLNKTSLKPKRATFKGSHISQDLNVDRATCSSTFKDKKFPEQLELSSDGMTAEHKSTMKVCPYQHCSLHGHKKDAAPAPNHSSYKKRVPLNSHTNLKPETKSASVANASGNKKQEPLKLNSNLGSSGLDLGVHGAVLTPKEKEKDVSFSIEIHAKIKAQFSSKTHEETGDSKASEITLGESSCLLESQKESLNEMMSSLIKSLSDLQEKSVGCHCISEVHEPIFPSSQENSEVGDVAESNIAYTEHQPTTSDKKEDSYMDDFPDIPVDPEAQLNETKLDDESEKHNPSTFLEDSDIGLIEQSKIFSDKGQHSTEPLDTSARENPSNTLEAGLTREVNTSNPVEYPEASSHHGQTQAKLGGGRNISMWQLIHQGMISSLASDVEARLPQTEDEGNQVEDTNKYPAVRSSANTERQEDKDNQSDDTMNQDLELRKVLAIKLVREAIEKILLPEVPDQSSDDQSPTSETTSEQDIFEQIHTEELKEGKSETDASYDTKGSDPCAVSQDEIQQVKTVKEDKSEKKAPKHWSNLKKWIILQRFVKALDKLKKINPRGPRYLELEPEPEGEKVALRRQTTEEKKNAEEWMLDYALRQAISQLAPTQKKKVSLLVKAFETVVPPQEDSDIHSTISKLKETSDKSPTGAEEHEDSLPKGSDTKQKNLASPPTDHTENLNAENEATDSSVIMVDDSQILNYPGSDPSGKLSTAPQELIREGKSHHKLYGVEISSVDESESTADPWTSSSQRIVQEGDCEVKNGESRVPQGPDLVEFSSNDNEEEKKNHFKMWHMVYHHVVSSIVEKVGTKILDGPDDDEDSEYATELPKFLITNQNEGLGTHETLPRSGFSRSEAVKLVQDAVDEILLPEIEDDTSETQSVTSDTVADQELSEKSNLEDSDNGKSGTKFDPRRSTLDDTAIQDQQSEVLQQNVSNPLKMKNWSKLKKLMLLKRSIRALEKARKPKFQLQNFMQLKDDPQPGTVDLRRQMMDEKKKAELWMLDYAVRNIVHTLTPARKRRVSMLVEAFEAVVPLPEM